MYAIYNYTTNIFYYPALQQCYLKYYFVYNPKTFKSFQGFLSKTSNLRTFLFLLYLEHLQSIDCSRNVGSLGCISYLINVIAMSQKSMLHTKFIKAQLLLFLTLIDVSQLLNVVKLCIGFYCKKLFTSPLSNDIGVVHLGYLQPTSSFLIFPII